MSSLVIEKGSSGAAVDSGMDWQAVVSRILNSAMAKLEQVSSSAETDWKAAYERQLKLRSELGTHDPAVIRKYLLAELDEKLAKVGITRFKNKSVEAYKAEVVAKISRSADVSLQILVLVKEIDTINAFLVKVAEESKLDGNKLVERYRKMEVNKPRLSEWKLNAVLREEPSWALVPCFYPLMLGFLALVHSWAGELELTRAFYDVLYGWGWHVGAAFLALMCAGGTLGVLTLLYRNRAVVQLAERVQNLRRELEAMVESNPIVSWTTVDIANYRDYIPEEVSSKTIELKSLLPTAHFSVEHMQTSYPMPAMEKGFENFVYVAPVPQPRTIDPFLVVTVTDSKFGVKASARIAVWDEEGFRV